MRQALSRPLPAWYTALGPHAGRARRLVRHTPGGGYHYAKQRVTLSHPLWVDPVCRVPRSRSRRTRLFLPAFLAEFHWARGAARCRFPWRWSVGGAAAGGGRPRRPLGHAAGDPRRHPGERARFLHHGYGPEPLAGRPRLWRLAGTATSACGSLMWALLIAKWFPGARRAAAVGILQAATPASPLVLAPLLFVLMAQ